MERSEIVQSLENKSILITGSTGFLAKCDTSLENLGIGDTKLINVLWREIDFIVNSAATTRFNERYDVSLNINTFGARNVMLFAKKCEGLNMFLHISTAYVTQERKGIITEKFFEQDELLIPKIETENELIKRKLKELEDTCASNNIIKICMKELGMKRANKFGWPNVYSFTKAMGELQIAKLRGSLPVIILRPTIILSTCKQPFPGWIEGIRTMDKLIISYAIGEIVSLPACLDAAVDGIPGDMVVNAMLATMMTNCSHPNSMLPIYHVGSSSKNTLRFRLISETSYKYFSMHPVTRKDGKLITVRKPIFFSKMFFCIYMVLRSKLPLQVLLVVATLFSSQILKNQYIKHNQTYNHVMLMAKAYIPYTFMLGRFDDTNTEILRMRMNNEDKAMFSFDPKCINWDQFLMDIHIPGVIKYGLNG
ncbi:hypothetical protein J5N97_005225 [Dioscorea zingiberensis]|uniref:Fatty acyl-CoA reductase n=1 Tax=Dioscorea zingiberensis TaxID=325984 RepID=A0A9D5HS61_9LILI|nr:hypothetical protein J5N97_005225 [Dioscorea zingiberensis]